MDWSAEYIKDGNYVRIVNAGDFCVEDQLRMMNEVINSDFWKPGMNVLYDCRECNFDANSLELIKKVSVNRQKLDAQVGGGKSALLMKSITDHARGRQYQLLTEPNVTATYQVFTDEDAALRWLLA